MIRKTIFVKPRLQLKYFFMTLLLVCVSTGVLYLTLRHLFFNPQRLAHLTAPEVADFQRSFGLSFLWVLLLLLLVFGVDQMVRFHRLAGPLYVFEKMVRAVAAGDLSQEMRLRRGDELKELVQEFNTMRDGLSRSIELDRMSGRRVLERLDALAALIDQGSEPGALKREIEQAQKELSTLSSRFKLPR